MNLSSGFDDGYTKGIKTVGKFIVPDWGIQLTSSQGLNEFGYRFYERPTLIKKKIKFSSYIRKFRVEQLQSHIWWRDSQYMRKCANISPYMRRPLVIYDFATAPFWISLYMRKIWFSFLSVQLTLSEALHASQLSHTVSTFFSVRIYINVKKIFIFCVFQVPVYSAWLATSFKMMYISSNRIH